MTVNPPGETPDVGVPPHLAAHMTLPEQHEWIRRFLARHPVSRRSALLSGAGAGALAALGLSAVSCAPAPSTPAGPVGIVGRHLSFGVDPTRQMAVAAELTAKPVGEVRVDIGSSTSYGRTVVAEIRELVSMVPQVDGSIRAADQFFVHAMADDLEPGGSFHYRIRLADGTVSPDAVFTTAPSSSLRAPFVFTAFADQGVTANTTPGGQTGFSNKYGKEDGSRRAASPPDALVALIAAQDPAFHLLAGDICYADLSNSGGLPVKNAAPATPPKGFGNFDPTVWTQYFGSIEPSAATTPWLFATGNHDMEALYDDNTSPGGATHGYGGHQKRLDLPRNGPSNCPSVYSVVYGNVAVLSIDANDLSQEIRVNTGYSGGAQLAWVTQQLAGFRTNPDIDFVVAFFHHCAFATSTAHASDGGVRSALAPLFDKYSVDLAVQGHNHQYERTDPIKGGTSAVRAPDGATVYPATDGTTYICCGSGGRPRSTWQPGETDRYRGGPDPDSGTTVTSYVTGTGGKRTAETVDWSQARYLDYAFLRVEVTPGPPGGRSTMSVRAISDLGVEIDRVDLVRPRARGALAAGWSQHPGTGLSVPA